MFNQLVRSIRKHGLKRPVLIDEGMSLLDGRARLGALLVLGIEPEPSMFRVTKRSPTVVTERNLERRKRIREAQRRKKHSEAEKVQPAAQAATADSNSVHTDSPSRKKPGSNRASSKQKRRKKVRRSALLPPRLENAEETRRSVSAVGEAWNETGKESQLAGTRLTNEEVDLFRKLLVFQLNEEQTNDDSSTPYVRLLLWDYLEACRRNPRAHRSGYEYQPSIRRLAMYCQCDEKTLRNLELRPNQRVDLEIVSIILLLSAHLMPGSEDHRHTLMADRIIVADQWLHEPEDTRGLLSARLARIRPR
ncbi:hypothetical protein [Rhodopirellula islandica]|nr:hypothetical protein [Rhodopirellula islandica]